MVMTEIILYIKYEKLDLFIQPKMILKLIIKCISSKQARIT